MFTSFYTLFTVLSVAMADDCEWSAFQRFQNMYRVVYAHKDEQMERFRIFRENLEFIHTHNQNANRTFTLGITQFADLTTEEFITRNLGTFVAPARVTCTDMPIEDIDSENEAEVDWRDRGVVNPVKDQGQCGSCWAFAATSVAESAWAIHVEELLVLSEQELVDCSSGRPYFNLGCNGGNIDSAFEYQLKNGQTLDANYPYTSGKTSVKNDQCMSSSSGEVGPTFSECFHVTPFDQVALARAVQDTPVAVAIEADTKYFQLYTSGILTGDACGTELDHAVVIVGYGVDGEVPYWTVRNSWGASWGEDGYVRIGRSNSRSDAGVCGIATMPSFIV